MRPNELTHAIIGAAIEVHRELGPGKPEAAYEAALARDLGLRGLRHQEQKPVPVVYKGVKLECGYRLDMLVADTVEVHRGLGPGLLPSAYEECLRHELHLRGVAFERKHPLALHYKGAALPASDEVSLVVGGRVVVSPRALAALHPVHEAQLLSQLRLGGWNLGLLINFNTIRLADGLRRFIFSHGK